MICPELLDRPSWSLVPRWWTGTGMLRIQWLAFALTWYRR